MIYKQMPYAKYCMLLYLSCITLMANAAVYLGTVTLNLVNRTNQSLSIDFIYQKDYITQITKSDNVQPGKTVSSLPLKLNYKSVDHYFFKVNLISQGTSMYDPNPMLYYSFYDTTYGKFKDLDDLRKQFLPYGMASGFASCTGSVGEPQIFASGNEDITEPSKIPHYVAKNSFLYHFS